MTNTFVITFADLSDPNDTLAVKIRSKLERLANGSNWTQVFPFQVVLQSSFSIEDIMKALEPEIFKTRISIFKATDWASNEARSQELLQNLF
ncbi:hypothetical protein, partial [Lentilactobacillus sp. SPB1-3]|uniref:Uncharacterized protein n=1 Tax=Lentilactobacillus terminaliae TaxID=3003483 RepID=A0ACD5DDP5_9LACO